MCCIGHRATVVRGWTWNKSVVKLSWPSTIHQGKINKFVESVTLIFISHLVKLGLTDCWSTSSTSCFLIVFHRSEDWFWESLPRGPWRQVWATSWKESPRGGQQNRLGSTTHTQGRWMWTYGIFGQQHCIYIYIYVCIHMKMYTYMYQKMKRAVWVYIAMLAFLH